MLLKNGSKGNAVKEVQRALGLTADGIFGDYTEAAIKRYQSENDLVADGIVGSKTFEKLVGGSLNVDTDRFGYDETKDKDNKIEKLGSYITEDGLNIDKAYLDSDEYVRDYGKIEPEYFFIHHTAGWDNPYNTISNWNKDKRGRVATQYCIGGVNIKNRKDKFDGKVVECFPDNYLGWHLGKVGSFKMSKFSSAVEVNNFGYVTKKGDKYYNYVNVEVPEDMVVDLGYKFRNHQYWHKYTEAQIESLRLLIKHVAKIYPKIDVRAGLPELLRDGTHPKDAFSFNDDAYNGKIKGLWTHTNVRKGKFDMFPQKELVEMLKSL